MDNPCTSTVYVGRVEYTFHCTVVSVSCTPSTCLATLLAWKQGTFETLYLLSFLFTGITTSKCVKNQPRVQPANQPSIHPPTYPPINPSIHQKQHHGSRTVRAFSQVEIQTFTCVTFYYHSTIHTWPQADTYQLLLRLDSGHFQSWLPSSIISEPIVTFLVFLILLRLILLLSLLSPLLPFIPPTWLLHPSPQLPYLRRTTTTGSRMLLCSSNTISYCNPPHKPHFPTAIPNITKPLHSLLTPRAFVSRLQI